MMPKFRVPKASGLGFFASSSPLQTPSRLSRGRLRSCLEFQGALKKSPGGTVLIQKATETRDPPFRQTTMCHKPGENTTEQISHA